MDEISKSEQIAIKHSRSVSPEGFAKSKFELKKSMSDPNLFLSRAIYNRAIGIILAKDQEVVAGQETAANLEILDNLLCSVMQKPKEIFAGLLDQQSTSAIVEWDICQN
jgi:hypothetical protein